MKSMSVETPRIRFAVTECSLGSILVAATGKGICAITFGDNREVMVADLKARFPQARPAEDREAFERELAEVVGFVEAPTGKPPFPLDPSGTDFQRRVWDALCEIRVGTTATYADVAARIGRPAAVRAVARACAANSIAVAIPCHRVVRRDGGLSGYRWGADRKRALLAREAVG